MKEKTELNRMAQGASEILRKITSNPVADMIERLDSLRTKTPIDDFYGSFTHDSFSFKPLKEITTTIDTLRQAKTVSQMVTGASAAMFAATSPLRSILREFSTASHIVFGTKEFKHSLSYRPLSHSLGVIDHLTEIKNSIRFTEPALANWGSTFGQVAFSTHFKHTCPAFAYGFSAIAAQEAAIGMAVSIADGAVSAESEKLFSLDEINNVLVTIRDILQSKDDVHRHEVAKRSSNNPVFTFMMSIVAGILVNFVWIYSQQILKELEIHNRSTPAIEYARHSTDKPHIGIVRRDGTRVYEKPDKRSLPVHKFIEGEFIALMWERQKGWRKVAYEVDLGTMKALKVGWIQDSGYDRTNRPVKSLYLRLYQEQ